jgi:arylsulfatase
MASHLGGLRDGLVIIWPKRIKQPGQVRTQFHHVIDIAPTIYEAAGITPPAVVDGEPQQPIDGTSMVYTFDRGDAPSLHREQYFELLGNRSFYRDGWLSAASPRPPWDRSPDPVDPATFSWELFDLRSDYSQSTNIAARYPAKLAELQAGFDAAAQRNHVYPLGADLIGRMRPGTRPSQLEGRQRFIYFPGDTRYPPTSFPTVTRAWAMTARVDVKGARAQEPILIQGDQFSGLGLLLNQGRPTFIYNPSGRAAELVRLQAGTAIGDGNHVIEVKIEPRTSGGPTAAKMSLVVDGSIVDSANAISQSAKSFGSLIVTAI